MWVAEVTGLLGPDHPDTHIRRGSGIEIVEHALDLDTTRAHLLTQIHRIAGAISGP